MHHRSSGPGNYITRFRATHTRGAVHPTRPVRDATKLKRTQLLVAIENRGRALWPTPVLVRVTRDRSHTTITKVNHRCISAGLCDKRHNKSTETSIYVQANPTTVCNLRQLCNIIYHAIRKAWGWTDNNRSVIANVLLQLLRVNAAGSLIHGHLDECHVKVLGCLVKGWMCRDRCYNRWVRDVQNLTGSSAVGTHGHHNTLRTTRCYRTTSFCQCMTIVHV